MNKKIHIETLGCRLNQIESESVATFFSKDGFSVEMKAISSTDNPEPDCFLAIVNTCTVTAKAEQKARRIIRLLLKKYCNAIIIVTGCYAQVNKEEIAGIDKRILVLPGKIKSRLSEVPQIVTKILNQENLSPEEIQSAIKKHFEKQILFKPVTQTSENPFKLSTDTFIHHSRSSIKIQDGCNNRCTYCGICIARGKSVSLDVEQVVEQVNRLIAQGQNEIVITSVNIAQYESSYKGRKCDIADLLEILLNETQHVAFRFSSLYPQIIDNRLLRFLKDERVRPHFHLSIQSGSDKILKSMGRPYNSDVVFDACKKLKMAKENPFIACDIIAGFPGESDEDFEKTMLLVKECGIHWVHAFPFSPRPGTKAFLMNPKVPASLVKKRISCLMKYSFESKINYINSIKGKNLKAIVEDSHNLNALNKFANGKKAVHAVTENFIHCIILVEESFEENKTLLPGSQITVQLTTPLIDEIRANNEIEALGKLCD